MNVSSSDWCLSLCVAAINGAEIRHCVVNIVKKKEIQVKRRNEYSSMAQIPQMDGGKQVGQTVLG